MQPVFKVILPGGTAHDYTRYIDREGLTPERNDIDADGAGRNLLDGDMYRSRITKKQKMTVKLLRTDETVILQLATDLDREFVTIRYLNPETNTVVDKVFYCSSIVYGAQMYDRSLQKTVYEGCTFSLIER